MKPANIIYGILGIIVALMGGALAMQSFCLLAFTPHTPLTWGFAIMGLAGGYLFFRGLQTVGRNFDSRVSTVSRDEEPARLTVEGRLDELERLKRRDMVTVEEYAAKRQEILKDL